MEARLGDVQGLLSKEIEANLKASEDTQRARALIASHESLQVQCCF
jgi:hypothetical protein